MQRRKVIVSSTGKGEMALTYYHTNYTIMCVTLGILCIYMLHNVPFQGNDR